MFHPGPQAPLFFGAGALPSNPPPSVGRVMSALCQVGAPSVVNMKILADLGLFALTIVAASIPVAALLGWL